MHMAFHFSERRTRTMTIVLVALVGIAACGSDPDSASTPPPTDAAPDSTSTPGTAPSSTAPSSSSPSTSPSTPVSTPGTAPAPAIEPGADVGALGPTAQRLVDVAAADLVERFDLSTLSPDNPIVVAVAEEVTWRDSALGCPMKDMQYMQVLTPGFRIVLEFEGTSYAYHSGAGGDPSYCASPETPAPSAAPLD
jgi:hypothetical protein